MIARKRKSMHFRMIPTNTRWQRWLYKKWIRRLPTEYLHDAMFFCSVRPLELATE